MSHFMRHGLGDCTEAHHCGCLTHMTEARDNARAEVERLSARVEAVRTAMQDEDCLDPWVGNYARVTDIRRALDGGAES